MLPDPSLADAPVILGWVPRQEGGKQLPDVCALKPKPLDVHSDLKTSIDKVQKKAKNYRMLGLIGNSENLPSTAKFFNDLETLDPTWRPASVAVWVNNRILRGIQIIYTNGVDKSQGVIDYNKPCHFLKLDDDGSETIFEIQATIVTITYSPSSPEQKFTEKVIGHLKLVTSKYKVMNTSETPPGEHPARPAKPSQPEVVKKVEQKPSEAVVAPPADSSEFKSFPGDPDVTQTRRRPDMGPWSLRGFFGFTRGVGENLRFVSLGEVWAKDKFVPRPPKDEVLPICKTFFDEESRVMDDISSIWGERKHFAGRFIMGALATTGKAGPEKATPTYFNHLRKIQIGWKITNIVFGMKSKKLTGITVNWTNGKSDTQGVVPPPTRANATTTTEARSWTCDVSPNLIMRGKITCHGTGTDRRIQTVEFITSEGADGSLPPWLLDVSTSRYMGDVDKHDVDSSAVVEVAPEFDNGLWSLRGFYGLVYASAADAEITALGLIWGRDP